ncbi:hypothetical protein QLQ12_43455 [Actinoplanes sp. NEAU-A12]|uniref:Secreted protein n=1 Tax=Actinoplanes sandaracinus TaxID=3045177 RepID=A0ABT6X0D8_9ACTN|nr:hypothetical protein [Actinoplanes sandaracinus]MDI6105462.1 hypothetical protein [Actinoplanes sandaracinus]
MRTIRRTVALGGAGAVLASAVLVVLGSAPASAAACRYGRDWTKRSASFADQCDVRHRAWIDCDTQSSRDGKYFGAWVNGAARSTAVCPQDTLRVRHYGYQWPGGITG